MSYERLVVVTLAWTLVWVFCMWWQGIKNGSLMMVALVIPVLALYFGLQTHWLAMLVALDLITIMWLMNWPKYPQYLTYSGLSAGLIGMGVYWLLINQFSLPEHDTNRIWLLAVVTLTLGVLSWLISLVARHFVPMDLGFLNEIMQIYQQAEQQKRRKKR